jgi:hypothetical protein
VTDAATGAASVSIEEADTATMPPNSIVSLELWATQGAQSERVASLVLRTEGYSQWPS